jgi:hypothetical protein
MDLSPTRQSPRTRPPPKDLHPERQSDNFPPDGTHGRLHQQSSKTEQQTRADYNSTKRLLATNQRPSSTSLSSSRKEFPKLKVMESSRSRNNHQFPSNQKCGGNTTGITCQPVPAKTETHHLKDKPVTNVLRIQQDSQSKQTTLFTKAA